MRICTLLPSATEIVHGLGFTDQLVAVSHSCNYPPEIDQLPRVTSTAVPYDQPSEQIDSFVRDHLTEHAALYDLDIDALRKVAPDVIISQALCDVCAVSTGDVLTALNDLPSRPQIIDLEPNTLADVLDDCQRVARALDAKPAGERLVAELSARIATISAASASIPAQQRPRVAFLEWLLPPFNGGHWNPELVEIAGGIDLLGAPGQPSSTQDWNAIVEAEPDIVFVACCGFTMERAKQDLKLIAGESDFAQLGAVREGKLLLADGNAYFSCPGPRLIDGLEMLAHALHPDIHPPADAGHCQYLSFETLVAGPV